MDFFDSSWTDIQLAFTLCSPNGPNPVRKIRALINGCAYTKKLPETEINNVTKF